MYKLDQTKTPLLDALMEYVNNNTVPFHVPGHKKGQGMWNEFKNFVGTNVLSMDVTVFKQVDSLHKPTGVIKAAQELAADAYNTDYTFFSIHGTSGAIQAMVMSVVGPGEKIIIPRNVHKSVTAGIILSGASPVYMQPEIDHTVGVALNVTPETVENALEDNPDAKAVLIVNPTYYGVSTDIEKIVNIVHRYNIPLIVDEAHGPHLHFNSRLPISAVDAGADICSQSTHKIIGSMTQSSLLHVRKGFVDVNRVKTVLSLLQTTSPSYILLASLDAARKQMVIDGKELLDKTIDLADYARKSINSIEGYYCFGEEVLGKKGAYAFDPTKVTITCKDLGLSGYELERILAEKYYIQPEMSDLYNVLCVFSLGDTKESVDKLINALKEISDVQCCSLRRKLEIIDVPDIPEQILTPRDAFNSMTVSVPLSDSMGQISAEFLMAYPPGIPILCPGEMITKDIIDYVKALKEANLYVQGTEDPEVNHIKVVSDLNIFNINE
ncbi:aminotransferase class I/II-fold pyridoxal phosphate-dependent enzyme [Lutispora saccharofermentans]|uniref:Aminotransferase class I/II-fold pyridoxal phosphate-dependent enzyme n=1 Tax=Lutispora saccharofermentans TaxID=3024236 RepID=A0ABT1NM53_9FIRM|nr:aminotransferase class I/II-fold pyridoxal phosphate-dependent enzyme [Lutispora saccharofermentans]MCQ1531001.1 aminotransferase class I/II-fold pyridoxal phosphate-dependent enzyme [Lutispora saccharofermentans]